MVGHYAEVEKRRHRALDHPTHSGTRKRRDARSGARARKVQGQPPSLINRRATATHPATGRAKHPQQSRGGVSDSARLDEVGNRSESDFIVDLYAAPSVFFVGSNAAVNYYGSGQLGYLLAITESGIQPLP